MIDGLRAAEERIMDDIGNLSDLIWIGGSAGDDLRFKETVVFANGHSHTNAAVLALIRLDRGFDIIKTQSFRETGKKLKATEVDEANRMVIKFNDQPAAKAYAAAIGYPIEKVSDGFMRYPVGVMIDGEPFVRSPQRLELDKMVFYCNIKQGTELSDTRIQGHRKGYDSRPTRDDQGPRQSVGNHQLQLHPENVGTGCQR